MVILDGKKRAQVVLQTLKQAVEKTDALGKKPKLVVITVGEDPASKVYVGQKQKQALAIGFDFEWMTLPETTTQETLDQTIIACNENPLVSGLIVQLPLPKHLNEAHTMQLIAAEKDVDGFHPLTIGHVVANRSELYPCTPRGIVDLLASENIDVVGKNVTIIGRSQIVGMPLAIMLINAGATVTVCHSRTTDLSEHTRRADILIVAVGRLHLVKAEDVKPGAVVVDVGINRRPDGKLAGDVDFEGVAPIASYITPVPGGVGPMTVAMLMYQTFICFCQQHQLRVEDYLERVEHE